MFFGVSVNLIDFRFRDVFGVNPRNSAALVMHAEHDVRRFGFGAMKELDQDLNDKLLRGVVVVVQDDFEARRLAEFSLGLKRYVAVEVFSVARIVGHGYGRREDSSRYAFMPAPAGKHSRSAKNAWAVALRTYSAPLTTGTSSIGTGETFQISFAYSRTVRSQENVPTRAMLRAALALHVS